MTVLIAVVANFEDSLLPENSVGALVTLGSFCFMVLGQVLLLHAKGMSVVYIQSIYR